MPGVTVVLGPPAAGKSTYVRQHAQPGDLVVDLDALLQALTVGRERLAPANEPLLPFVCAARDALVQRLARPHNLRSAWLISTNATAEYRSNMRSWFGAAVVVLAVPPAECMRRIRNDQDRGGNPELWQPLVDRWWAEYRPTAGDRVLDGREPEEP